MKRSPKQNHLLNNRYDIIQERPGMLVLGYPGMTNPMTVMLVHGINHRSLLDMYRGGFLTGRAFELAQSLDEAEQEDEARMGEFVFDEKNE